MQFQIKDLMIVLPEEQGDELVACAVASCGVSCGNYGCTRPNSKPCAPSTCKITVCNVPTRLPTQPLPEDFLPDFADQLAALKDQLRVQMAAVEAQEQILQQRMGPQSLDEVAQIEQALRGALDEVGKHKRKLQDAAGATGSKPKKKAK